MIRKCGSLYTIPIQGCTNPYADNYNPLAQIDNGSCVFSPSTFDAVVSEGFEQHGLNVVYIFEQEYGGAAQLINSTQASLFEYVKESGIKITMRSTTGLFSFIPLATQYYPDVPLVMPLGSNQTEEIHNPATMSVIVACGAGDADDVQNMTGYGNGLEFWDNEGYFNPVDESSYAVPIIAAKILTIMEARECGFWEARYCARFTADRNEPNRPANTIWHNLNGFGKINVANAIAYNGSIPSDPFLNNGNLYTPFLP